MIVYVLSDVWSRLVRVMIHIVAQCHEEGLEHYLRSYVKVSSFVLVTHCKIDILTKCLFVLSENI